MIEPILLGTLEFVKYLVVIAVLLVMLCGSTGCVGPLGSAFQDSDTIEAYYKGEVALLRAENENRDKGAGR